MRTTGWAPPWPGCVMQLGRTLEEITDRVAIWDGREYEPVRERSRRLDLASDWASKGRGATEAT